jgi:hypothetical protein
MAVTLLAYADEQSVVISLPGPFSLEQPGVGLLSLDPETQSWQELDPLFSLRDDRITRATATRDAALRIEFSSGHVLSAHSSGQFENWEVSARGYTIVGTPNEVTVWDQIALDEAATVDATELGDLLERLRQERRTDPV